MKKKRIELTDEEIDRHCCTIDCMCECCALSTSPDIYGVACLVRHDKSMWLKEFDKDWLNEEVEVEE